MRACACMCVRDGEGSVIREIGKNGVIELSDCRRGLQLYFSRSKQWWNYFHISQVLVRRAEEFE